MKKSKKKKEKKEKGKRKKEKGKRKKKKEKTCHSCSQSLPARWLQHLGCRHSHSTPPVWPAPACHHSHLSSHDKDSHKNRHRITEVAYICCMFTGKANPDMQCKQQAHVCRVVPGFCPAVLKIAMCQAHITASQSCRALYAVL